MAERSNLYTLTFEHDQVVAPIKDYAIAIRHLQEPEN
jgi:hypothetical protein